MIEGGLLCKDVGSQSAPVAVWQPNSGAAARPWKRKLPRPEVTVAEVLERRLQDSFLLYLCYGGDAMGSAP